METACSEPYLINSMGHNHKTRNTGRRPSSIFKKTQMISHLSWKALWKNTVKTLEKTELGEVS
jgi:hypothetical protein